MAWWRRRRAVGRAPNPTTTSQIVVPQLASQQPQQPDAECTVTLSTDQHRGLASSKASSSAGWWRGGALGAAAAAAPPSRSCRILTLADLPAAAIDSIWAALGDADRRSLRIAARGVFDGAVRRCVLRPRDLPSASAALPARFPALGEIVLRLPSSAAGSSTASADLDLVNLIGFARAAAGAGAFPRLHTLEVEGRIRGAALTVVARLSASWGGSLQRLRLPGLRLSGCAPRRSSESVSAAGGGNNAGSSRRRSSEDGTHAPCTASGREERSLCGMLESMPCLIELDLGGGSAGGAHGGCSGGCPLPPSVLRRVGQLRYLQVLSADASAARDGGRGVAALLSGLPLLQRLTLRVTAGAEGATCSPGDSGDCEGSGAALARAICGQTRLETLDLESPDLGEDFAAALRPARLVRLQSLALGLCPLLPPSVAEHIASLPALRRLALPFTLDAPVLRHLARLPALSELLTFRDVDLEGAAPSTPPCPTGAPGLSILSSTPVALAAVTKLVAAAVRVGGSASSSQAADAGPPDSGASAMGQLPRHELACVLPALRSLYVRAGGDEELRLAAGCGARLESLVLHGAARASDAGLALLRACRGLVRLHVEEAPWVTDVGVSLLFGGPTPSLQHLALHRMPQVSDASMQSATAVCRRLVSVSLTHLPDLTDKTLSRLSRMEHLTHAQLVRLGPGVTAEGVRSLAAAPAMQAVSVAGCSGVRAGGCRQHRASVRVRIDDAEV